MESTRRLIQIYMQQQFIFESVALCFLRGKKNVLYYFDFFPKDVNQF